MSKLRRIASMAAALVVSASSLNIMPKNNSADAAYGVGGTGNNVVEYLDRGINAINTGNGMFVSWRWNANDADNAEFQLYRDNKLIYTSKSGDATSYLDKDGKSSSKYRVDTLSGGKVVSSEECKLITNQNYFNIPLKKPGSNYTPNDCSVGDVDGDGQYEIFLKWDPSNSKDNSQEGKTDNVYIDCYTLEGKQLWRIDLGKNIRAGQHYTQFLVADFDLDGKAEMTCKTADGTVDGTGKVIGDKSKDYRNSKGYVLDGPEYYTLFDGATGKALDTVNYEFPRGKVSDWGDNYGNRVDRFLGTVAYLDGVRPSAVSVRGYYTRMTVVAYDVVDKKLKVKWKHDSGNDKKKGYGGGNHNCMPADVDNDGKQEIFLGATCIDHDGKVLWANGRGHGDAMHIGDLVPDRPGLEAWVCHEESSQGGVSLLDAKTGEALFHKHTGKDTGRCAGDNVYAGNKGAELWGAESSNVYNSAGKSIGTTRPAQNFLIYWDGDLEREILDGTKISKYTSPSKIDTIFTANGCTSINSTKSVPCLTADIFGDWREELVMASSDGNSLRIYCTPTPTKVRLTTLMHDVQYRMQVATEQNCYNQPPHVSYYLGSDVPLPERPNVKLNNTPQSSVPSTPGTPETPTNPPSQSVTSWSKKFDLGANAQSGFTSVKASEKYDKNKGYGFTGNDVKDVAASGKNELSDAVQFTGNTTFNVDLPNGVYKVKVTLGNTGRTSVYMENQLQIVNMTGNNAVDEILIPITDGQLNIRAAAGKSGNAYTISSIEIDKVSDEAVLPSTIWLCGDSTVCNYYPLNTSTQGGWGQMLGKYVDKGWNIRNMAASGSYAQAFSTDGSFATVEKYGKAGDVFIISIGINDSKYYNGTEYKKIVTDMVKRAKAKGMEVILVKQQGRNGDAQKNPLLTSRWYAAELDQVGKEQNCQVVDLFKLWQDYCISIGASKTNSLYMDGDALHPNRAGAEKLAELFASQFKQTPSSSGSQTTPTPTNPPASSDKLEGKFIKNLVVKDTKNAGGWKISNSTSTGETIFGDRDYTYNSLPDVIKGAEAIQTACDSKNTDAVLAEFTAGENIDVYVLLDTRVEENGTVPSWLGGWTKTGLTAETSNDVTFSLYKKSYKSGEKVELGTNGMSGNVINYTVFVKAKEEQTVPPTEAPTSSGQSAATLWGDANCDGDVTIADATAILQYLGSKDKYPLTAQGVANADVSAPEGITANDAITIQQVDSGIISQKDLPLRDANNQTNTDTKPDTNNQPNSNTNSLYYAVDMKIESGVKEDTNEGFKGTAYVNLDNMIGSNIEWTVNTVQDGNYLCTFNIANGSADNRSMKIEVNNGSDYWLQDFLTTGNWTKWEERGIVLPLKKGENKIRMTSVTTQGGPNLDYLKLELTDEPIAETYDPEANKNPGSGQQNVARTIYIAGDSTVQTYKASYAPQQGWGAYLGDNLSDMVSVSNQAIAGRSSKSFYDNGRLDTILGSIKQGDYLLIQFGINDSASGNAERYAPVSGKIPGTNGSFEYYMAKYIEGAKAKGATPILVTTVIGLKAYNNSSKKFETSYPNYCNAMKNLAKHYDVPIIDLNTLMVNHYNSIGYDAAYKYHLAGVVSGSTDMTHFSETGAKAVAKLVADELKNQGLC